MAPSRLILFVLGALCSVAAAQSPWLPNGRPDSDADERTRLQFERRLRELNREAERKLEEHKPAVVDPADIYVRLYLDCQRAEQAAYTQQFDKAAALYRKVAEALAALSRDFPKWQPSMVEFRTQKVAQAIERLRTRSAQPDFRRFQVDPKRSAEVCARAIADYRSGEWKKAADDLTTAILLDPQNARAHFYLGLIATEKGWLEMATRESALAREIDAGIARELEIRPNRRLLPTAD